MSGPLRIQFSMQGDKVLDRALLRFSDRIVDPRPAFEAMADLVGEIEKRQFDSEGQLGPSGRWKALSPGYAARKELIAPGRPILELSGRMRREATVRPFGVEVITRDGMEIGVKVPYAKYHQSGTPRMPQRKVYDLTENAKRALVKVLQRWIVEAQK